MLTWDVSVGFLCGALSQRHNACYSIKSVWWTAAIQYWTYLNKEKFHRVNSNGFYLVEKSVFKAEKL